MACKHGNTRWILSRGNLFLTLFNIFSPPMPCVRISTSLRTLYLDGSTAASSSPTPCLYFTSSDACLASSLLFARFSFNASLTHTFLYLSHFQVYFYRGVLCEFGANVGRLCLALLVFSAGMFISSTAFLPSTTSMYLCLLSMGAWFHQKYPLAIFTTALSTFLSECRSIKALVSFFFSLYAGWPFAALLGLPIAIDIVLIKNQWKLFITWSIISATTILLPQVRMTEVSKC